MYIHIHIYTYICTQIYMCVCVCMYIYMCTCIWGEELEAVGGGGWLGRDNISPSCRCIISILERKALISDF